jgi:hypothetical protein
MRRLLKLSRLSSLRMPRKSVRKHLSVQVEIKNPHDGDGCANVVVNSTLLGSSQLSSVPKKRVCWRVSRRRSGLDLFCGEGS